MEMVVSVVLGCSVNIIILLAKKEHSEYDYSLWEIPKQQELLWCGFLILSENIFDFRLACEIKAWKKYGGKSAFLL